MSDILVARGAECPVRMPTGKKAIPMISRGSVCYQPVPMADPNSKVTHRIDKLHMKLHFAGSRLLQNFLVQKGFKMDRLHFTALMRRMGIESEQRKAGTST